MTEDTRSTRVDTTQLAGETARCKTCGSTLDDPGQRFCGGDRCAAVVMRDPARRERSPLGSIGYTGTYRAGPGAVVEVSVVSVLEARGPE